MGLSVLFQIENARVTYSVLGRDASVFPAGWWTH